MDFDDSLEIGILLSHRLCRHLLKPRQVRCIFELDLVFRGRCYPIEPQALHKILFHPRNGSDECDEPRITASRARLEFDVSHNKVRQKRSPWSFRASPVRESYSPEHTHWLSAHSMISFSSVLPWCPFVCPFVCCKTRLYTTLVSRQRFILCAHMQ